MARPDGSAAWRVSGLSCGRGVIKGGSLAHLAAPGASRALSPWNMTLETCDPGATCGKQRPAPPLAERPGADPRLSVVVAFHRDAHVCVRFGAVGLRAGGPVPRFVSTPAPQPPTRPRPRGN